MPQKSKRPSIKSRKKTARVRRAAVINPARLDTESLEVARNITRRASYGDFSQLGGA
ncbi:MAG: hypothetical protein IT462_11180 [Planctomycetes bacterium]|nr:hypothetical protein [Planctomycetota bacterium]